MSFDDFQTPQIVILPNGRMTAKNAALYVGLADKTMAMHRCAGTGPAFSKIGGRIYYTPEALDTWLDAAGECTSTAQARFRQQQQGE
jgi:hypothetical protein